MKATAIAPSNIAFIKYWGKKDEILRLPENGSISMNLSDLYTTTTVEFSPLYEEDSVEINGVKESGVQNRAIIHLNRIRSLAKIADKAKVVTTNNFPSGTGLSSSASGFAALTVSGAKAAGLELSEKELSILGRSGSGSSCRSIPNGITEWLDGKDNETSYAVSLYPYDYWDILDVVVIVSREKKDISSTEGQKIVRSSPFFHERLKRIKNKIVEIKRYMSEKDFRNFGELVENEALELHAIMLTSNPPLIYWLPGTLQIMRQVKQWRAKGIEVYFTVNTGQDIHLIIEGKNRDVLLSKLKSIPGINKVVVNKCALGAHLVNQHLF